MDCFIVLVVIKDNGELLDKPVAVCHSDSSRGVKADMFVKEAKTRTPKHVFVPYDFGAYKMTADRFYEILHKHCYKMQVKRRSDAEEPVKYMGNGDCENMSLTITIPMATDDVDVLQRLATQLFGHFKIVCIHRDDKEDIQTNMVSFPHSLKKLTLHGTELSWEDLNIRIGSLPLLQDLRLHWQLCRGLKWETVEGQFCSLRFLHIECCYDPKYWETDNTHFPRLEHLHLEALSELEKIPSSRRHTNAQVNSIGSLCQIC